MATDKLCAQCPGSKVSQNREGGREGGTDRGRGHDRSSTAKRAVPNYCHFNEKSEGRCKQAKVRVSCSFS